MKKRVYLLLIIIWMGIIFGFSNKPSYESDEQSDKVIDSTVIKIANFFKNDLTDEQRHELYLHSIFPVRKYAHIFEFFVLYILVFLYLNCFEMNFSTKLIYSLLWCVIYAIADEAHQLFVFGRTGRISDVIIDNIGSLIGLFVCRYIKIKKDKKLIVNKCVK